MLVSRDVRVDEQSFMNQQYSSWTVQKYETLIFDPCEITTSQPRSEPYMQSYKEPTVSDLINTCTTIPTNPTKSDSEVQPSSSTHVSFHHSHSHACYNLLNLLYQVCHNNHLHQNFLSHQIPYHLQNPYLRNHV